MSEVEMTLKAVEVELEVLEVLFVSLVSALGGVDQRLAAAVDRCFATAEDVLTARVMASASEADQKTRLYGLRGLENLRTLVRGDLREASGR